MPNRPFSSAVGLYMLAADGEGGAEVYSLATTRDQARIVFGDAQAMARASPGLAVKATGDAAGMTKGQLEELAHATSASGSLSVSEVRGAEAKRRGRNR